MGSDSENEPLSKRRMMKKTTERKKNRPVGRALALLAGFILLFGAAAAEEDVDLADLLDLSEL